MAVPQEKCSILCASDAGAGGPPQAGQRLGCPAIAALLVSKRFDGVEGRDALNAGYHPKNSPTEAEKPIPMANDHQGRSGKTETRWTAQPMPAPRPMPIRPTTRSQKSRLHQELKQESPRAARRALADAISRAARSTEIDMIAPHADASRPSARSTRFRSSERKGRADLIPPV